MIVVLNPNAGGGTALLNWKRIEPEIRRRWGRLGLEILDARGGLGSSLPALVRAGETQFVAAGGDGTINGLVQAAMTALPEHERAAIAIGAIGLGSSNDFHKPVAPGRRIAGVPCRIEFTSAVRRDVGVVTFRSNGTEACRYFLINASAGLTAHANRFFNAPDGILRLLKRGWTGGAILYAAARSIRSYVNAPATLSVDGSSPRSLFLTNLAVLKNPHVAGSLQYPDPPCDRSGAFRIHVLHDASRLSRLRFLHALSRGRLPAADGLESWTASTATIAATAPFPVETDGEAVLTTEATFSLLPQHLRVCTC